MKSVSIFLITLFLCLTVGCDDKKNNTPPVDPPVDNTTNNKVEPAIEPLDVKVGTITGVVKFEGKKPEMKELNTASAPECHGKHDGPIYSESLVLGTNNSMANILVQVANAPESKYAVPEEALVVTQEGCKFSPHVFASQLGQKVVFLNPDGILHNVHGRPSNNKKFNRPMPGRVKELDITEYLKNAETTPYSIKCDAHPWMLSYHAVIPHPFFNVTKEDGKFELKNVPVGTYKIVAWHEKMGTLEQEVTVKTGEIVNLDFTFKKD